MDLTAPLIFVSIFVMASTALFLVYKFGMRKKSFEEALAEQRKQTNALLGSKPKPKEKKNKKAAKKINKEKSSVTPVPESETPDETESVDSKDLSENPKPAPTQQNKASSQKASSQPAKASPKQNKIRVEFKEEPEEVEVPAEKEVINKKEDIQKTEPAKEQKKSEKSSKRSKKQEPPQQSEKAHPVEAQPVEKEKPKEEKAVESRTVPLNQESVVNAGKEKKKKKSEYNAKQQMTAERDQLINSVRTTELSRTEVQMLIDFLLNKQLEAPAVIDDWSEGKSDPLQKLKKQLAEKEKLLVEEQEALAGVQAKLKEVRGEQLAERSQLQQKLKVLEESKLELVTANNRLQQKLQELQDQRNKEINDFKRVVEDNKALQLQRGQLEVTLMNYQETDALIHNLKTENNHLTNELQRLTQEMQEQATNYQNCAIQINTLQEEVRSRNEYVLNMERNHEFAVRAQIEEKRGLSEQLQRLKQDFDNARNEEQKLLDGIAQLKVENQKLQEERKLQMNGSSEESKAQEVKLLNLSNELSSVKIELSSVNKKFQDAERQYQTEIESSNERFSRLKSELEEQKNKNNELRKKNWKVMEALNAAESRNKPAASKSVDINVDQISLEIKAKQEASQKEFLQRLFPEIESLKTISSDDWQTEFGRVIKQYVSQLQRKEPTPPASPGNGPEVAKLQLEVQHYKKVLDETDGALNKLQSHIELEERNWRRQLSQKDAEIQELKSNCLAQSCETETNLNTPDSNGIQFAYKCMEKSLPHIVDELQVKVTLLENQLAQEQMEKQRLLEEHHQLANRPEIKSPHADSTATIEKLSEEIDRLNEQLRLEQSKNGDSNVYQNGETS